jgi:mannose-6-phosphate isomerase-like protein (cupin superfamily)
MVVTLAGGCRVSEMREGQPSIHGTLRLWNRIGRATGAQAISLRVMEFAAGMSPGVRNADCDEILYVLGKCERDNALDDKLSAGQSNDREAVEDSSHGQARSTPPLDQVSFMIDERSYKVTSDTGFYIRPRQTFAVENPGPESIVIISSQCPDPDSTPYFAGPPTTSESGVLTRQPFVRLADRPAQPTADRWYQVLVDDQIGSTQVTQFVGSIPPGRAPDHFHNYEEVLFILKGEGRMWAGETNTPIARGSCIYLPRGQVHCVENTGEGELRLLGVFYPAGSPSVRYDP